MLQKQVDQSRSLLFADMELRNSHMYGVDVVFHQQLLQVTCQHTM